MVAERTEPTDLERMLDQAVVADAQCEVCGQPAEWEITSLRGHPVYVCDDDQSAVIRVLGTAFPKREVRIKQLS